MEALFRGVVHRIAPGQALGDVVAVRRPFDRDGLLSRMGPFAAVALAGVALVAATSPGDQPLVVGGAFLMVLVIATGLALSVVRLPAWLDALPPLLAVVSIAILRHAAGGAGSGLVPLFALPITWSALYGSGIEITAVWIASSIALFLPIIVIGAPDYPSSEWSVSALNGAIGLLVGLTVNGLVRRLRAAAELDHRRLVALTEAQAHQAAMEAERERELTDLSALLAVGRELARPEALATVRATICSAALAVSDAAAVLLFEPRGTEFVATASAGRAVGIDRISAREPSGIATSIATGETLFSGRLAGDPRVSARAARQSGAKAGYWQPIGGRGSTAGVLLALWDEERDALAPRVERLLNIVASQAEVALELAALVERLEGLARNDPLTGLANRRTLESTLPAELDRAARSGRPLSLVMLDLDHFKAWHDDHGHPAGDALLVAAARAWQRELRPSDLLVRYGGEEFLAVLPDCSHDDALVVAERLRAALPAGATASAGVATARAGEGAGDLVGRADAALYRAKQAGRNRTMAD